MQYIYSASEIYRTGQAFVDATRWYWQNEDLYKLGIVSGSGSDVSTGESARKKPDTVGDILSNKTFTNSTGKVNNYTSSTKGMDAAWTDFNALNPKNVRTAPNGTILGDLPNGTTINIHPGTSVSGSPTLQIPDPTTGVSIKIRY